MNDSTYIVQAERITSSDTIYYQINKVDLKILYQQAFGEMVDKDLARDQLVLGFTYIPLILIFIFLITLVNVRWNKAYKRIKNKSVKLDISETDEKNIKKLDLQYLRIPSRIFFYLIVWIVAAVFDSLFMLTGIFEIPWAALLASIFTISKIITRLVGGSTLMGIDDSELSEHFGKYVKGLFVDSIANKIKKLIDEK